MQHQHPKQIPSGGSALEILSSHNKPQMGVLWAKMGVDWPKMGVRWAKFQFLASFHVANLQQTRGDALGPGST